MLAPARRMPQPLTHGLQTVLPPIKGINSIGSIASMPETDAIEMDNMVATDLGLSVREGWYEYATNIGGDATRTVRTVMSYEGAPANSTISPLAQSTLRSNPCPPIVKRFPSALQAMQVGRVFGSDTFTKRCKLSDPITATRFQNCSAILV